MSLGLHFLFTFGRFGAELGQMRVYLRGGLDAECSNEVAAGSVAALRHFGSPLPTFTSRWMRMGFVLSGASICDPSDKLFRCGPAKLNGPLARLFPGVMALSAATGLRHQAA
jgi:hypothetical protein